MGYSPWGCKESDTTCHLSTHYVLEPYILGCEVKWALRSLIMNKASGGDGIPTQLVQILKEDAVKVLHSKCHQFGKLSSVHRTEKGQYSYQFIPKKGKGNAKECSSYHTISFISHASKVMLKILPNEASTGCERRTPRCASWI